jgi:hypothetical protein
MSLNFGSSSPACVPTVSRATDELEKAKEALASAENAAAEVDAKLEAVFGVPADFPDDLDPVFRPEGMEDRVKRATSKG